MPSPYTPYARQVEACNAAILLFGGGMTEESREVAWYSAMRIGVRAWKIYEWMIYGKS